MMDPIKAGREIKKANKRIAVIKGQRAALVKTCNALAQAMKANKINITQRKTVVDILCLVDNGLDKEMGELKSKINMWYLDIHQAQDSEMGGYTHG
ncbi:hypothetical protein POFPNCPI_00187 [Klebsiella phage vB_KpM-Mild]|uniref:Uncharacterized protein n=1 Tax=Klebsiella phage K14-2 TaxID=3156075 RepID=A0AB39C965_9VIRU|nr:hypothetical protein [Klebsiella phage vB_KpnM_VAC13]QYC51271.1 hypothetical protein [Klebsiella phage vB_KpnM-VAC66]CAD5241234.1 hypothetical protein GCLPFEGH_00030 [Klebsiella phage vB_KpM-KalD]CAD5241644.1 hypothetical protein INMBNBLA_00082 [Klebsiella phage vB_KoM-Liquor]CAD5242357.1 hypothetical protein POFPNCPI_00187 [Klebsiella phage vB_KpM-Mild]CAD5242632.1 hypothetical protein EKPIEFBL_00234 [Klebsiella phage vB_KpM-Milk]CAK6606195.1 unknown function [Klebsiella phage vB_Ko_K41P2